MAKQKKAGKSDEETLRHYETYESAPISNEPGSGDPAAKDTGFSTQPHLKKVLNETLKSKPKFIKAKIAVDRLMSTRKSAVIAKPPRKKDT